MPETQRLFIALELPLDVQDRLEAVQDRLRQVDVDHVIRWTQIDGVHLTLKFLGDVDTDQLEEVELNLIQAVRSIAPFALAAEHIGAFPLLQAPQTIWAGVGGDRAALLALRAAIESGIVPLGFPTEARPFAPHLTLGRVKPNARRGAVNTFGSRLSELDVGAIVNWQAVAVNLMQSDLHPSGARYTRLAQASLSISQREPGS